MSGRRIAAFDFDGTLTRRDTLLPFLARATGPNTFSRTVGRIAPVAVRARAGRLEAEVHHRDATKAALLRELFRGRSDAWLQARGQQYATTLGAKLRPEMVEQVRWHRDAGHELVIVSASLATYLTPFAAAFGFDHVIAVEMQIGSDGHLTGEMTGPNVRGEEKAVRLRRWIGDDTPEIMWAYGNSSGDTELLAMADVPVWVVGRRRGPDANDRPAVRLGRSISGQRTA
ncbi:MAG: HAD-superfamily subfamily hydrolase [Ilumatobacteraceae bacterium]|nr:HAD-superfamily subfamily hydrolase [Ilumatobacteraceae bacterium]